MEYVKLYSTYSPDLDDIIRLNSVLTTAPSGGINKVRTILEQDPSSALNAEVARRLKNVHDSKYANYALIHYFRSAKPEDYSLYVDNPNKYFTALGFSSDALNKMRGGSM